MVDMLCEDAAKLDGSNTADESMKDELSGLGIAEAAKVDTAFAKVVSRSV